MTRAEPSSYARALLIGFVVLAGLVILVDGSVLAAVEAAEWAGVGQGGWNWQYLPAFYGGLAWGVLGFGVMAPVLYRRSKRALVPTMLVTTLIVVAAAFVLSLVGHLVFEPA